MDCSKIVIVAMLLCFFVQFSELFRISGSQANDINMREDHTIEDAFMVANVVTQDEIEEFHRANGFATPSIENEVDDQSPDDVQQSQARSFGHTVEALKFWNWSAFDHFRLWIEERRRRTTTIKPIPVYIVNNPHESIPYNGIYASRPPYFK
ncbi:uncharacterized protein LOC130701461 [Daphnia carinata]|uniref:uncharacterized protein LOC130701461 n=1 Tax=Daphnia carinata TaxID=120202 RepID=UPI00257CDA29|nr:uncharacterized protein LOC130701461 [Daphnia carinata]